MTQYNDDRGIGYNEVFKNLKKFIWVTHFPTHLLCVGNSKVVYELCKRWCELNLANLTSCKKAMKCSFNTTDTQIRRDATQKHRKIRPRTTQWNARHLTHCQHKKHHAQIMLQAFFMYRRIFIWKTKQQKQSFFKLLKKDNNTVKLSHL